MLTFPEIELDEHGREVGQGKLIEIESHHWIAVGVQQWKGLKKITDFYVMSVLLQVMTRHLYLVDQSLYQCRSYVVKGDRPFVLIGDYYTREDDEQIKCFSVAQQLQANGGWGTVKWKEAKGFQVAHPKFTRGALGWRWVSLQHLADFLKISPESLWNFYRPLWSPEWEGDLSSPGDHLLRIAVYDPTKEGNLRFQGLGLPHSHSPKAIWVPAGWAMDVCRLHALNYRPDK